MDFGDMGKMMAQAAAKMQEQMEQKLSETVVEAQSGGVGGDGADEWPQGGAAAEDSGDRDGVNCG